MKNPVIWSGVTTLTVPAQNSWSPWTTIWTPPIPLNGFKLFMVGSGGNIFGVSDIFIGGGTPSSPATISQGFIGNANMANSYPIRLKVPANTPIQLRNYQIGSATGTYTIVCVSLEEGGFSRCQTMGSSTSSYSKSVGTTWTLFGTTLPLPVKHFGLTMTQSSNSLLNLSVGIGPSSTSVAPIIENILLGDLAADYIVCSEEFDNEIPPSQQIWMQGSNANALAGLFLYY